MPKGARSPIVAKLTYLLATTAATEMTDQELKDECGMATSPGGKGYGFLNRAIKRAARDHGVYWQRAWNQGRIVRANSLGNLAARTACRDHIRRTAQWSVHIGQCANLAEMDEPTQRRHRALQAQQGAVLLATRARVTRKLAESNVYQPPPPRQLLEALIQARRTKPRRLTTSSTNQTTT
jgi:hypothetical protein